MQNEMSRRAFLMKSASAGVASLLFPQGLAFGRDTRRLTVGSRVIEVNGRPASVFGITSETGEPGLTLAPDEPFSLSLENQSGVSTIVHWHGQVPSPEMDGVADTGYAQPIENGGAAYFDFRPRPGTHWMHSHHGLQEQSMMTAPLIVRTKEDVTVDIQEVVILLNDFSFRSPEEILQALAGKSSASHAGMANMPMGGMPMDNSAMAMGAMDLNDVTYDAYLANDRTLDDPQVVRTERGGRVRLRIINGAATTAFWLDLGEVQATVVAVDGNAVLPIIGTSFPLAAAQRIDLILDVAPGAVVPVMAVREGGTERTGIILAAPEANVTRLGSIARSAATPVDMSLESRLVASAGLVKAAADIRHSVMLTGSMSPYAWGIDGEPWQTRRKLEVKQGQRVELEFVNRTMMAHPMHLHGHHFQVVAIDGQPISGAVRDTINVPSMGAVTVAFDADNPGRWLYHCHNLYHMASGMMSEVVYI